MKKKTFIVQLLDSKKPSRTSFTQVEDANFYSNDTDASLVFIPHEDSFDFQSAKVVMYNRGDESLVERDAVVTTEDGRKVASYELPDEIIAHWGDWTAQPVFINGGEIYSGSIVPFSVIRYLMHERPATLTEIVTVTEFIQQSQALVDDMEQAEAQRASAESSRISAEIQRASAESSRVSAEAQRKIDHANRSAELAGKADKVVLKNLIENGDFSIDEISSNFVISTSLQESATINDGKLVLKPKTFAWNNSIRIDFPQNIGDKIYCRFTIDSPIATRVDWRVSGVSRVIPYGPGESTISFVNTVSSVNNIMYLYTQDFTPDMVIKLDKVKAINLTKVFGAGNEPSEEEMDELTKFTGYFDGEYALNNKEMLIWTLALIRRNKNAIVAFGGA